MNFSDEKLERLQTAIDWSNTQFETPRQKRMEAIKEFVGFHHSDGGASSLVPVNMLKLAVEVTLRTLAARTPRALITSDLPSLRSTASNLEIAVNLIPDEIQLGKTLRRLVMEALFSPFGIVKIGLHTVGEMLGHDYGEPFVDLVTIEDYFCDMSAESHDQIQFEGNDYWLDRADAAEAFGKKAADALVDDQDSIIGERGGERAKGVTVSGTTKSYKERVWLRDVWLPYDGLMLTYAVRSKKLLSRVEWDGPESGPYQKLGFTSVPSNLLPLPPVAIWRDLHEIGNSLFRKMANGAEAQKECLGFGPQDEESVLAFKTAKDGEGLRYQGTKPEKLGAGGINQTTLAFFMQCRELFSYFAGNLDTRGGLAPMAETLGQDRLLSEAAGAQTRDMASQTVACAREIFRALTWYEWHNPIKIRSLEKPLPGDTGLSIQVPWGPEDRQGDFNEFNLDIDVYSLIDDSPNAKLQRLGLIMQQYVIPLMPAIQAQGGQLNAKRIVEAVFKLSDLEELADVVSFIEPHSLMEQQQGQQQGPQHTTRTTERVSRPGATPRGKNNVLQRMLLGDKPQQAELDVLGRG